MRIDPANVPLLPNASLNADHAREARLVNEVLAALEAHQRGEGTLGAVVERLSVLAVQTREHFLREETLMREARYQGYAAHKAEHDRALAEMDAEARLFRERGDGARLARYLAETLPGWVEAHQRAMDAAASRFTAEQRPTA
jgi:hemerythrin